MDSGSLTLEALKNYYKVLRKKGYVPQSDVYNLVVLSFIADLYKQDFAWYIEPEDYDYLNQLIQCLGRNSCLISFSSEYIKTDPINNYLEDVPIKISESEVIKFNEEDILKLHSK